MQTVKWVDEVRVPRQIDIEAVFAATVELFCERGLDGTTTREIAGRAGVNEVTLFRRFGSKAKLVETAVLHTLGDATFGSRPASDDLSADLQGIVNEFLSAHGSYGGLVVSLFSQMPHHEELRSAAPMLARNFQMVAAIMATHQERGRLRSGDPIKFAFELIAPLAIARLMKEIDFDLQREPLDVEQYVRTYLNGHAPH